MVVCEDANDYLDIFWRVHLHTDPTFEKEILCTTQALMDTKDSGAEHHAINRMEPYPVAQQILSTYHLPQQPPGPQSQRTNNHSLHAHFQQPLFI